MSSGTQTGVSSPERNKAALAGEAAPPNNYIDRRIGPVPRKAGRLIIRIAYRNGALEFARVFKPKGGCFRPHRKKVRLPPTWGMRAGAFVATMQAWLREQPVANYFDTRSGLPETPGRRRDRWL
jgi:hypothetical protein